MLFLINIYKKVIKDPLLFMSTISPFESLHYSLAACFYGSEDNYLLFIVMYF